MIWNKNRKLKEKAKKKNRVFRNTKRAIRKMKNSKEYSNCKNKNAHKARKSRIKLSKKNSYIISCRNCNKIVMIKQIDLVSLQPVIVL